MLTSTKLKIGGVTVTKRKSWGARKGEGPVRRRVKGKGGGGKRFGDPNAVTKT